MKTAVVSLIGVYSAVAKYGVLNIRNLYESWVIMRGMYIMIDCHLLVS
jgi:hypothetical protein